MRVDGYPEIFPISLGSIKRSAIHSAIRLPVKRNILNTDTSGRGVGIGNCVYWSVTCKEKKMETAIFLGIDKIIERVDSFKVEPEFSYEIQLRKNNKVPENLTDNQIIEIFTKLIAYSQNANSKLVEGVLKSGILKEIFANYDIDEIIKLNPCDLADDYWDQIGGIRQQAKLFHIVSLARKIKRIGSFHKLLIDTEIPKEIRSSDDIEKFWIGFKNLKKITERNKIPFFRSTISLLHFLLETGYDCIKPDLAVMKVALKLKIIENVIGDENLIRTVRTVQEYSLIRGLRPSVVDLYFLIDGAQLGAKKFVDNQFYEEKIPAGNTI